MVGSIRFVVGIMLCFGAVGGLDVGSPILACLAIAMVGLGLMYSAVDAMNRRIQ